MPLFKLNYTYSDCWFTIVLSNCLFIIPKSVVSRPFHIQPTLSESIKLSSSHGLVFAYKVILVRMMSFHLILSFNYNWSGLKLEIKKCELNKYILCNYNL